MNHQHCHWFRQIAHDFSQGVLVGPELDRAQEHMFLCEDCLTHFETLITVPPSLTTRVLRETNTDACEQARDRMPHHLDSTLGALETTLFTDHLDHCAACHDVFQVMIRLGETLPTMRDLEPPPWFLGQVLGRTSQALENLPLLSRLRQRLGKLIERPRFALEVAYVLSLLLFLGLQISNKLGQPFKASKQSMGAISQQLQASQQHLGQSLGQLGFQTIHDSSQYLSNSFGNLGSAVHKATESMPDKSPVHYLHQKLYRAQKQLKNHRQPASSTPQGESYE